MAVRCLHLLSQFQSGDCGYREHDAYDPESGDNFGLRVAFFLVVVVERTHQEYATSFTIFFLGVFEVAHLNDDAQVLCEEYPSDNWKQKFFAYSQGQYCDDGTYGQ